VSTPAVYSPGLISRSPAVGTVDDVTHDARSIVISENFVAEATPKLMQMGDATNDAREQHEIEQISYELDSLDTPPRAVGIYHPALSWTNRDSTRAGRPHPKTRMTPQEPGDSAPMASRYIGSEGETVGKFKYYSLHRIGSTNAPRYYPRGVASSTLRHYAPSPPRLVKRSRRRHIINCRQNGANRRL
jgi:hypothetical protein